MFTSALIGCDRPARALTACIVSIKVLHELCGVFCMQASSAHIHTRKTSTAWMGVGQPSHCKLDCPRCLLHSGCRHGPVASRAIQTRDFPLMCCRAWNMALGWASTGRQFRYSLQKETCSQRWSTQRWWADMLKKNSTRVVLRAP